MTETERRLRKYDGCPVLFISRDAGDIFVILGEDTRPDQTFPAHNAELTTVASLIDRLDFEAYNDDEPPAIIPVLVE